LYGLQGSWDICLKAYIKGLKGEGLYMLHVSLHKDYVLGTSSYNVWNSRVVRVKVIEVIGIYNYKFIGVRGYIDYKC
jgi:hypothetical protein